MLNIEGFILILIVVSVAVTLFVYLESGYSSRVGESETTSKIRIERNAVYTVVLYMVNVFVICVYIVSGISELKDKIQELEAMNQEKVIIIDQQRMNNSYCKEMVEALSLSIQSSSKQND